MTVFHRILLLLFMSFQPMLVCAETTGVTIGKDNKLIYSSNEKGDRIPDYSHCGYEGGNKPIPNVPVQIVVSPIQGDNTERIQNAIDYVSTLPLNEDGFRGSVLLLKGQYPIHNHLRISKSGVVLRGQGINKGETELVASGNDRRTLIQVEGVNDRVVSASIEIKQDYVPVGSYSIHLDSTKSFNVGDSIEIIRPSTKEWIDRIGMSEFAGGLGGWLGWKPGRRDLTWDRVITSIDGNQITIDAPITTSIDTKYGGGYIRKYSWPGRISKIGIENLSCTSEFDPNNSNDEEHSWMGVTFQNVENAWVRQIEFSHFVSSAVAVWENCKWITVQDCLSLEPVSEIGGYRRHSFFTMGQMTLFLHCYAEFGRHDFSVGHCAAGPNAFVQCQANQPYSFSGPIESWASGVLYDNVSIDGNALRLVNRERKNQGVGWSAANCVLWQCDAAEIHCESPQTSQNWSFGSWSEFYGNGHWDSSNEFINPQSLFAAQLSDRLGSDQSWIQLKPLSTRGATSPSIEEADAFTKQSMESVETLFEYIKSAGERNQILSEPGSAQTLDEKQVITVNNQFDENLNSHKKEISILNGWITVNETVLSGKQTGVTWWRGNIRPNEAEDFGAGITRFVPGRFGKGLTDELNELTDDMLNSGNTILNYNHGLWYDRRRDDHERIRRMDGDVVPPFFEMPFARSGEGKAWDGLSKYDLTKFNPWYWKRLQQFASLCDQKGLILNHHHYFQHNILEAGAHWTDYPWRSANNVNNTGFPEPPPYIGNKRIFMDEQFYDNHHPVRRSLHRNYIRKCLENFKHQHNVIHFIGEEYTGPTEFVEFWIDTIIEWMNETGMKPVIGLSCTKDVQDAILFDPVRSEIISVIDIRYWWYQSNQELYAPKGGKHLAPRQHARLQKQKSSSFDQVYRAVREYKDQFPKKAVLYSVNNNHGWAVFMAGGSILNIPKPLPSKIHSIIPKMKPLNFDNNHEKTYGLYIPGQAYMIYIKSNTNKIYDLPNASGKIELIEINPIDGEMISRKRITLNKPTLKYKCSNIPCVLVIVKK